MYSQIKFNRECTHKERDRERERSQNKEKQNWIFSNIVKFTGITQ